MSLKSYWRVQTFVTRFAEFTKPLVPGPTFAAADSAEATLKWKQYVHGTPLIYAPRKNIAYINLSDDDDK